jgi:hypothetical protein
VQIAAGWEGEEEEEEEEEMAGNRRNGIVEREKRERERE